MYFHVSYFCIPKFLTLFSLCLLPYLPMFLTLLSCFLHCYPMFLILSSHVFHSIILFLTPLSNASHCIILFLALSSHVSHSSITYFSLYHLVSHSIILCFSPYHPVSCCIIPCFSFCHPMFFNLSSSRFLFDSLMFRSIISFLALSSHVSHYSVLCFSLYYPPFLSSIIPYFYACYSSQDKKFSHPQLVVFYILTRLFLY